MDIAVVETLNGGDILVKGNDLASQGGWGNMVYLALFGGNIEGITKEQLPTEQNADWWGNNLLFPQDEAKQFNSLTEKKLSQIALGSSGRAQIEQVIRQDLVFMKTFANITVTAKITGVDQVEINIAVREPDNLNGRNPDAYKEVIMIWDATKQQLGDFRIQDFNNDFYV